MKLATASQMKELDRQAIEERHIPSIDLMERAAEGVAQAALDLLPDRPGKCRVAAFCGAGNNGGDGFIIARAAAKEGWKMGGGHPARYLESVARLQQLRQMPVTELLSYKNRPLRAGLDLTFRVSAQKGRFVLSEFCHPQAGSHRFLFQEMA